MPVSGQSMRKVIRGWFLLLIAIALSACAIQPQESKLPAVLINVPVSESAIQTRDALASADHIPQDRFKDAVAIRKIDPAKLEIEPFDPPQVGDQLSFYVNFDFDKDFRKVPATLRYISENGAWWVADDADVKDEDIKAAADNFENIALKINRLIYGPEPRFGVDQYDHINFLFVNIPEWGEYYGYFSVINQFPTALKPYSNEKEMLVLNTGGAPLGSAIFNTQLAHEFGHLIHWSVDPNEDLWMNEAFSEMAGFLAESPAIGATMDAGNQQVYANYPFIQLNARPDTSAPDFDRNIVFAHYGAERLLMVYLLDRFGPQFIHDLIVDPLPGVQALNHQLGKLDPPLTFDQVYADWLLANLLNQPDHPNGRFGYSEVKTLLPSIIPMSLFTGEVYPGYMRPYSAFYYEFQAVEKVKAAFLGATMARLTSADPFQGDYVWYSNRGDETSFTLTRTFDLTQVNSATLNYAVWYELEKDYDYGYVLASVNDGEHWDVLPTKYSVVEKLGEDAYGMGYTSASNGWLSESLDLSQYAGKNVTIRFVVNTDLATNLSGMMIDNISIPEIDYFDGAEDDRGGWEAQGFIRSSNFVPVDWIVWIVKVNNDPSKVDEVVRVDMGDLQTAIIELDGFGKDYDFAAMVISPVAPTTTMSIDYEFSLTGK